MLDEIGVGGGLEGWNLVE